MAEIGPDHACRSKIERSFKTGSQVGVPAEEVHTCVHVGDGGVALRPEGEEARRSVRGHQDDSSAS